MIGGGVLTIVTRKVDDVRSRTGGDQFTAEENKEKLREKKPVNRKLARSGSSRSAVSCRDDILNGLGGGEKVAEPFARLRNWGWASGDGRRFRNKE